MYLGWLRLQRQTPRDQPLDPAGGSVHSRVGLWCHAVVMVGSQGLPARAVWMASMGRTPWLRELTR